MSSTSVPATTTSSVNMVVSPNPVVGNAGDVVAFYGSAGQAQADAISVPTLSGTYATDVAALQACLDAMNAVLSGTGLTK